MHYTITLIKYVLLTGLFLSITAAVHGITTFSITAYTSSADSPLVAGAGEQRVILDFENETPGVLVYPGLTITSLIDNQGIFVLAPGVFTDSVDGDDNTFDGSGQAGQALGNGANAVGAGNAGYLITFDSPEFAVLPTQAGLVWTDGSSSSLPVHVTFFDGDGVELTTLISAPLGDGGFSGGTAEDRFFGAEDLGGIGSMFVRQPGSFNSMEIDHLQWVVAIPEPSSIALALFSLLFVLSRRR
ncbi:MAG: hypothetical protein AAGA45_00625 [Verrucomicrobiota bacterium]